MLSKVRFRTFNAMESSASEVELLKATMAQLMRSIEDLMKERNDNADQIKEALLVRTKIEKLQKEYNSLSQLHTQSMEKAKDEQNRLQSENNAYREHIEALIANGNVFRSKFDELAKLSENIKIRNESLELENRRLKGKLKDAASKMVVLGGDLNKFVDDFNKPSTSSSPNPRTDALRAPASLPTELRRSGARGLTNGGPTSESAPDDWPAEVCAFCKTSGFRSQEAYLKHVGQCR